MLPDDVKSRLAAAFVSTQHTIGTCKDLVIVIGSCPDSITRERIIEVLINVMEIMNQQRLEDVDVHAIEDGIIILSELQKYIYTKCLSRERYFKDSLDFILKSLNYVKKMINADRDDELEIQEA
ncbi:hypothetical protein Clacol_008010 [Clathrus columnatus]|uniref:Uncharacterized protein n=1 Tax=Clathrus columnatus TaxID=1419009 RepID=A0AAV5AGI7_9AGAM|nr:hypothetical protein Clacol_008010 [Clathrus columnatus]